MKLFSILTLFLASGGCANTPLRILAPPVVEIVEIIEILKSATAINIKYPACGVHFVARDWNEAFVVMKEMVKCRKPASVPIGSSETIDVKPE